MAIPLTSEYLRVLAIHLAIFCSSENEYGRRQEDEEVEILLIVDLSPSSSLEVEFSSIRESSECRVRLGGDFGTLNTGGGTLARDVEGVGLMISK